MRLSPPRRVGLCGTWALMFAALFVSRHASAEQAQWIWSPEHSPGAVPQTTCHFRKGFTVISPQQGAIAVAADDQYELYVNGRRAGSGEGTAGPNQHDITRFLTNGRNLIALRVTNTSGSTAALAARVEIRDRSRRTHHYVTDGTWVTSLSPLPFWYTPMYNDARWDTAQVFGPWGATPPWDNGQPLAAAPPMPARAVVEDRRAGDAPTVGHPRAVAAAPAAAPATAEVRQELPIRVDPQFEVERLLDNDSTGSLIAMTFNEFGHILAAREDGELLLIHETDGPQRPMAVRVYGEQVRDCQGILCLNGDVYVTGDGPTGRALYRLRDRDRDGRLDDVETLVKFPADSAEYGPHGLTLGSDGFLYVVVGSQTQLPEAVQDDSPYRGYYQGDAVGRPVAGAGAQGTAPGGALLRIDITGKKIQVVAGGLRNAYGLAFNREGDLFTFDSDRETDLGMPWYQPPALHHVVAGAEFGGRGGSADWPDYYVDRLPGILDAGRAAPTGMVFYQHYLFPEDYHDSLFVADWAGGRILNVKLKPHGASYSAHSEVFLEGDSLSISGLGVGPDGWLYFVTGGRGTVGGLYRVRWKGKPPQSATDLGRGLSAVIRQPQLDAAWSRQTIASMKVNMGEEWDPMIRGVAMSSANPWQYRTRALDLMQLFGPSPTAELLISMSQVKNEQVRFKAAELMGIHADAQTETALLELLVDSDRRVRRKACEALLRAGHHPPLVALIPLLMSDDRHEAWTARRLLERLPIEQWRDQLLGSDEHRLQIQAALALLIAEPDAAHVRQVLEGIVNSMQGFVTDRNFVDMLRILEVALSHGEILPADVPALGELVAAEFPASDPLMNRILVRLLAALQAPGVLDRCVAYLESRDVAELEKLHLALHLQHLPGVWTAQQRLQVLDFFEQARRRSSAGETARLASAARSLIKTMSHEEICAALALGASRPDAALMLLYHMPDSLDAATFQTLEQLDRQLLESDDSETMRLKIGIVAVLARSGDPASLAHLRGLWDRDPERRLALAIGLAQWPNEANWHYLVQSLSVLEGDAAREVLSKLRTIHLAPEEPEFYRQVILRALQLGDDGSAEAVALLEFWTGRPTAGGDEPGAMLADWQDWYAQRWPELPEAELPAYRVSGRWDYQELLRYLTSGEGRHGSPARGAEVFEQVHCAKCHRIGNTGSDEGPDLSLLSRRAMKKEVLESVLFPSHVVPEEYRTSTVVTARGRKFSGRIVRLDDPHRVFVVQADGRVVALARSDVEEILPEKVSAMPEGLLNELDLQEIADLFAFLLGRERERLVERPQRTILR